MIGLWRRPGWGCTVSWRVGPVVISEVQYNPGNLDGDQDLEFVEIFNPTAAEVDLTDWRIRKGIDFDFPPGATLPANSALIVVPFDPADAEQLLARNNPRTFLTPAPIDFHCDFNRDQRVNATDMLIARSSQTHLLDALQLITVPGSKSAAAESQPDDTSSLNHTWLYELEPTEAASQSSQNDKATREAVDLLLTITDA